MGVSIELERNLPFSVFVDALDEYVESLDAKWLAVLDDDVQVEPRMSSRRCRRVRAAVSPRPSTSAIAAIVPCVRCWTGSRRRSRSCSCSTICWADSASVELLGALLRRPPAEAVLMALARRPGTTPDYLSPALERAHRLAALTRIELCALTPVEARVPGGGVGVADATVLYEESGGNPLYLEQLARARDRAAAAMPAAEIALSGIGVPSAVAASLSEGLALLSDGGRRVLEGAAVAGDRSSRSLRRPPLRCPRR